MARRCSQARCRVCALGTRCSVLASTGMVAATGSDVRHAYFTGADQPYDKLKRALRAEIDEAAWAALYRTTSRPFAPPATDTIAVKVINHYGDEVLKVYEVKVG